MKNLLLPTLLLANTISALTHRDVQYSNTKTIPAQVATGNSDANFISSKFGLDGPQLTSINSSSYDWWYFDVISSDLKSSLTIVFETAPITGFTNGTPDLNHITFVNMNYRFANGTNGTILLSANGATVTTVGQGSSGVFNGTGWSWEGSQDLSYYKVTLDSPESGLVGSFTLKSKAAAHYPCGPAEKGQNMQVAPTIGWSNAVPDAVGDVNIEVLGSQLKFTGVAYHDKNWSNQPFIRNVQSWYWGHGRLGPYSLVWFNTIDGDGKEYVSSYAYKDGEIVASSCTPGALEVRPVGSPYPPSIATGDPTGYTMIMDLGNHEVLNASLTSMTDIVISATYSRWAGSLTGSVNGGEVIKDGVAVYEQFKLV